jgi:hypothetical protein
MDYGKSFSFVFEDEEWIQKILIGGILSLIPIVNLVVVGYGLKVLKNAADGLKKPLPDWDDFGDYFVKGLVSSLGALVWALPAIGLSIVIGVISALTGYDTDPQYISWTVQCCLSGMGCLSGLYGLFMAAVMPAVVTKYAVTGELAAMFRFREIYQYITSNLGPYIIALLLGAVAMFIAGFGLIVCIIGVAFTSFWATLVSNHLLGEVYRASEATSV